MHCKQAAAALISAPAGRLGFDTVSLFATFL